MLSPQRHRHRNRRRALCVLHFSGVLLPLHPKRRRNFIAPIAVDVAFAIVAAAVAFIASAVVAAITFSLPTQRHIHFRRFHLVTIRLRYACRWIVNRRWIVLFISKNFFSSRRARSETQTPTECNQISRLSSSGSFHKRKRKRYFNIIYGERVCAESGPPARSPANNIVKATREANKNILLAITCKLKSLEILASKKVQIEQIK